MSSKIITLITGSNQGIGLATAQRLALESDHHIIIASRNAEAGSREAASLQTQGRSVSSIRLDLTDDFSIAAAVQSIEEDFGRLDVLINNAGILLDSKHPEMTQRQLFKQTFDTNVVGTACLTEALLPLLQKSLQPKVVFVSSIMGSLHQATVKNSPFYAIDYKTYDASKAAVNMLALNYARVLEPHGGVVNCVCPGLVRTQLSGSVGEYGVSPEVGAERIVEIVLDQTGINRTFSNKEGSLAW